MIFIRKADRYELIVERIIRKSFPELKNKNLKIPEYNFTGTSGGFVPAVNWTGVHKRCRDYSEKELEALLAYGISNIDYSGNTGFLEALKTFVLMNLDGGAERKKIEFEADRIAIMKGYARQTYDYTLKHAGSNPRWRYYMTSAQIRDYAKRIGKW